MLVEEPFALRALILEALIQFVITLGKVSPDMGMTWGVNRQKPENANHFRLAIVYTCIKEGSSKRE